MPSTAEYTVGWITALPLENTAAIVHLDDTHDPPNEGLIGDSNVYTFGEIKSHNKCHNVVVATMPYGQYGLSSATSVAKDMVRTFPNIRFALMVGIGGGAPTLRNDVRLGDVVVSAPKNDGNGGVLQYDFGKLHQDRPFERTMHLNQPPKILLSAASQLINEYLQDDASIKTKVDAILEKNRKLQKSFQRPDLKSDRLYRTDFIHSTDDAECEVCCGDAKETLVPRKRREDFESPKIHHGLIASANQLLKNPEVRDDWSRQGVLCFETEAAGLMNDFPCLVVRGICDYADSHKNEQWQGYAAMTAATYAKDLLKKISPLIVVEQQRAADTIQAVQKLLSSQLVKWLAPPDVSSNLRHAQYSRLAETGKWFMKSDKFITWRKQDNSLLWLKGAAGCGKTCLSSMAIDNLSQTGARVLYFYFDSRNKTQTSTDSMIRSLIYQIHKLYGDEADDNALYEQFENGARKPSTNELSSHFKRVADKARELWMVFDAIDECEDRLGDTPGLLNWLENFMKDPRMKSHVLITSREEYDIQSRFQEWETPKEFIESRLEKGKLRERCKPELLKQIQEDLDEKSKGMFLLAFYQLECLEACIEPAAIKKALEALPKSLSDYYNRILASIPDEQRDGAVRLLQLLTYSDRPLRLIEVVDGLAVNPDVRPSFSPEMRIQNPLIIQKYCASFLSITEGKSQNSELLQVNPDERPSVSLLKRIQDPVILQKYFARFLSMTEDKSQDNQPEQTFAEVQLAHPSIKEHLKSQAVQEDFRPHLEQQSARGQLALVCVSYLRELEEGLCLEATNRRFPFAHYCSGNWMQHVAACEGRTSELTKLAVEFFLSSKFTNSLVICDPEANWDRSPSYLMYDPGSALYYASLLGLEQEVKALIEQNAEPNVEGAKYETALQAASYTGHTKIVQLLVKANAEINPISVKVSEHGKRPDVGRYGSPLQAASRKGHLEVVKILLTMGANVNFLGGEWGTALQASSSRNIPSLVHALLEAGARINQRGGKYGTAVQAAASHGNLDVLVILLKNGANPNIRGGKFGSAIYAAAFHGHIGAVRELMTHNADINLVGIHDMNPRILPSADDILTVAVNDDSEDSSYSLFTTKDSDYGKLRSPLYGACIGGHEAIITELLQKGADPNIHCGFFGTALMAACWKKYDHIAKILIERGAKVDEKAGHFGTALQIAAYRGNLDLVRVLLEAGAQINCEGGQHQTALQCACTRGHIEIVSLLVDKGANINAKGRYGYPLQAACLGNHEEIVDLLISRGSCADAQSGWFGTALQAASFNGNLRIVKLLLKLEPPPNINARSGVYGTALFAAAYNTQADVLNLLLCHGADVDALGGEYQDFIQGMDIPDILCIPNIDAYIIDAFASSWTGTRFSSPGHGYGSALCAASTREGIEVVRILLDNGADLNFKGGRYGSPLHGAVRHNLENIAKLLLGSGAYVDIRDERGATPLFVATERESYSMVKVLLRHEADPSAKAHSMEAPLHVSLASGNFDIMAELLEAGADTSEKGNGLGTALFRAALIGREDMVQKLLQVNNIDVDNGGPIGTPFQAASFAGHDTVVQLLRRHGAGESPGGDWNEALILAVSRGYSNMARILVEHGADVDYHDEESESAIELAYRYGHYALAMMLKKHGADRTPTKAVLDEAIAYYERTVHKLSDELGNDHARTIQAMTNLSRILMHPAAGEQEKAIDLMEEIWNIKAEHVGHNSLETISALNDLALALASQRHIDRATELLQRVADSYRHSYGLSSLAYDAELRLAYILIWQGEIDAAHNRFISFFPKVFYVT
ncbi:ankyrin repeat [Fusarium mundagurra]|uniref:Ankyrin repeat n=1 Tax=Fusarium mundagurra TaxID=1567541 RepID=A0A8H6DLQ4_9HYPO|nr:ankyrin repeat [Fusarium mundagurra]